MREREKRKANGGSSFYHPKLSSFFSSPKLLANGVGNSTAKKERGVSFFSSGKKSAIMSRLAQYRRRNIQKAVKYISIQYNSYYLEQFFKDEKNHFY